MERCTNCGANVPRETPDCPRCGTFMGFPNVRDAEAEQAALHARYEDAVDDAKTRGAQHPVQAFEGTVDQKARAAIALPPPFLRQFLESGRTLYAPYESQVDAGVRWAAPVTDDRARRAVDSKLFGTYASRIVFAVLSLDGLAPRSYGSCTIELSHWTTERRASLLECNSFHFVEQHGLRLTDPVPAGYRATWGDAGRLAVAKLADRVYPSTQNSRFPRLLVYDADDRDQDDFIEVHIHGAIDLQSVNVVATPRPTNESRDPDHDMARSREWARAQEITVKDR